MKTRPPTLLVAVCLAVLTLAAVCSAQSRNRMSIDIEKESGVARVVALAEQFKGTSDTNVLVQLASLVEDRKHGAKAVGALAGLRPKLTPDQISSIVVPALIKGLQGSNAAVRREAALSFCQEFTGAATPAVPALIGVLEDRAEAVNASPVAAEALGKIGPAAAEAIPSLLRVLENTKLESEWLEDGSVRARAAQAIGRIGIKDPQVRKQVEKALADDSPYVRAMSAQALLDNNCEGSAATRILAGLMKAEDVGVRRFALQVIEGLKSMPESLQEPLKGALNDPDSEVASAARAALSRKTP